MLLAVVLLLCACAVMAVVSVVAYNAVAVSLAAENADAVGRCWRNVCRCCCWC